MSYDIDLFVPQPGLTLQESFDQQNTGELKAITGSLIAKIKPITEVLKAKHSLDLRMSENCVELIDQELVIEISFFESGAGGMRIVYGSSGARAKRTFQKVCDILNTLKNMGNYHAYDPQWGEFFSDFDDNYLEKMLSIN